MFLLVDSDGRIASDVALGLEAIRTLSNATGAVPGPLDSIEQEPERNGAALPTAGLIAAGATLASAFAAEARADDPGILALKTKLDAAQPTLLADVEALQ